MTHALVAGVRDQAGPPRRVRRRGPAGARPDASGCVYIPDLEREAVAFHRLCRGRDVAGHPAAPRARRPARGRRRQHRQLRRGDVHGAGRDRQRRRPGRAPTPRRSRSPARTSTATGGRRPACSRPRSPPRWRPARRVDDVRRRGAGPGPRRHAGRHRGGGQGGRGGTTTGTQAIPPLREAVAPYDTVGQDYRSPVSGRPPAEPAARHRGAAGRARAARGGRRRRTARRCSARSTTAGTPTRPPRWPVRSPARSAAPAAVPADWSAAGRRGVPDRPGRAGAGPRRGGGRGVRPRPDRARWSSASPAGGPEVAPRGWRWEGVRLTWVQPEDLLPHELAASRGRGPRRRRDRRALAAAGGTPTAPAAGARACPAPPELRAAGA